MPAHHRLVLSRLLPLLLLATGFVSPASGGFRPADIAEMVFSFPAAAVGLIEQGKHVAYSPDASADAADALRQALLRHDEKLHLTKSLTVADSALRSVIPGLILRQGIALQRPHRLPLALAAPWLDTLLTHQKQRYCLLSWVQGYTRTAANYRGRLAKDLGIGLLSLGTVVPISRQAATQVGVFIYDAQQHAVVYDKTSFIAEQDPLAGVVIDRELTDLLAKDFRLTDRL